MTAAAHVDTDLWGAPASGVASLERELARMRRVQSASAAEQGHVVARASVLNLVVHATREVHARRAAETIAELAQRHPSRAIIVHADRDRPPGVEAQLSMHCHLPSADAVRQVSYEQILIRARGDSDERLASAVIPLLLPDLPVFLWWTGTPPLDARHFDDLLAFADRFIVDSADFARPDVTLPRIAQACESGRGRYGVTDFNWTRLTPWRDLVAGFFDVADWRAYLPHVSGVRVGFAVDADGRDIHPSQALLLVGWLASRLGWKATEALAPSEAGGLLFRMSGPGGAIQVRVRPRFERGLEEGDLSGLRIQAQREGRLAEFVVKRVAGTGHALATVSIDGRVAASRTVPLPAPTVTDLLGEELTIAGSDRIYEEAMAALVRLA
ncbi:MAG TPA: glucose-6-phosphate dehydrogenase assembly protein OpcA [Candidatus Limnocylindria bacterium]|nr:glucose-6-phosphate dehydrogenase assembly protein OpcA [Candidatus Limnocylindria bacterium]